MYKSKLIKLNTNNFTINDGGRTIMLDSAFDTVDVTDLGYIFNKTQDKLYFGQAEGIALAEISSGVITIDSSFDVLSDTDEIHIQLWIEEEALDKDLNVKLVEVQNQIDLLYTDVENLVTASDIGATDDTWVDQGSEIDVRGYKTLSLFINLTVNNSTGNQLQILSKHTLDDADEYVTVDTSDYQVTLGDSNVKYVIPLNVEGIPFIQLQTKATDVDDGGGTEGTITIDIIKEY
jgi:hypothetical protein